MANQLKPLDNTVEQIKASKLYNGTITLASPAISNPSQGATVIPLEDGIYPDYNNLKKSDELCIYVYESSSWVKKLIADFEDILSIYDKKIFEVSDISNIILGTDTSLGAGVLSAVKDVPAFEDGFINRIVGNFEGVGICKFSILKDKELISGSIYKFTKVSDFQINILKSGYNSVDVFRQKIEIKTGEFIAVQKSSTSQPYFGVNALRGNGWYQQNGSDIGTGTAATFAADAGHDFNFTIANDIYAESENTYTKTEIDNTKANITDIYNISEQSNLVSEIDASNAVGVISMINDVQSPLGGILRNITGRFTGAGICKFSVLRGVDAGGGSVEFTKIQDFDVTIPGEGSRIIDITSLEVEIKEGYYLGVNKTSAAQPYYGTDVSKGYGWYQTASDFGSVQTLPLVANAGTAFSFDVRNNVWEENQGITCVEITVERNVGDFNSIRETQAAITDESETKRYILNVPNGSWFECDLIGRKFIEIKGQDKYLTILYCDGTSSEITPSDYSFPTYANMALSSVPQIFKHCFNIRANVNTSNLTIEANDAKYCVHSDYDGDNDLVEFHNCFVNAGANVNHPVGIGLHGGQVVSLPYCEFGSVTDGLEAIFFHNWNNQDEPCRLKIENSDFKNCDYLLLDELGSEREDLVTLINCKSDIDARIQWMVDFRGDELTYWVNPATGLNEPNPQNVPYCIKLNFTGTRVVGMDSQIYPYGGYGISRPDFDDYINGELYTYHFTKSEVAPVAIGSDGNKGEIRIDGTYVYVCISENNWKRILIETW